MKIKIKNILKFALTVIVLTFLYGTQLENYRFIYTYVCCSERFCFRFFLS